MLVRLLQARRQKFLFHGRAVSLASRYDARGYAVTATVSRRADDDALPHDAMLSKQFSQQLKSRVSVISSLIRNTLLEIYVN